MNNIIVTIIVIGIHL